MGLIQDAPQITDECGGLAECVHEIHAILFNFSGGVEGIPIKAQEFQRREAL